MALYEIIVIDSGNDDTEKYITFLKSKTSNNIIYVKADSSSNRSYLRNLGVKKARGDVLLFIDNDMLVSSDFIEKHFSYHGKSDQPTILLGKRRSLINFNYSQIGEKTLQNHFELIERLPYFEDIRDEQINQKEQSEVDSIDDHFWRFVFSHNFSINKKIFSLIGGFDNEFGSSWGYEDIEFGFRAHLNDIAIVMDDSLYGYHQPHFEQSISEQYVAFTNKMRFIRRHNYYEVELYTVFPEQFNIFLGILDKVKRNIFNSINLDNNKGFDNIHGCLYSYYSNTNHDTHKLGVYLKDVEEKSINKVLVLRTFYYMPEDIQLSILNESLRIGRKVFFQKDTEDIKIINKIGSILGFSFELKEKKELIEVIIVKSTKPKYFYITIPDVITPTKRYVYLFLVHRLLAQGAKVIINDLFQTNNLEYEDFCFPKKVREPLSKTIQQHCNGSVNPRRIISAYTYNNSNISYIDKYFETAIIDDFDYKHLDETYSKRNKQFHFFDSSLYQLLSFLSVLDSYRKYQTELNDIYDDRTCCCFMENGYKEDGIDIIIDSFYIHHSQNQNIKLIIKVPDYEQLIKKAYPLHNASSKSSKSYGLLLKTISDMNQLKAKIKEYNLLDSVKIIQKNADILECFTIINSANVFLNASRISVVSPEIYAAILLRKKTIIPEHIQIGVEFYEYCMRVRSEERFLTEEFGIPNNCKNVGYLVGCTDIDKYVAAIVEYSADTLNQIDIIEKHYNKEIESILARF